MNITFRRSPGLVLAALLASGILSSARADTYIRGTQASYAKEIDKSTKANSSSVYVDEANDLKNVNYAEFSCDAGAPLFFLNSGEALITQKEFDKGDTHDMLVKVDSNTPVKFITTGANNGDKPNLKALALDDKYDAQMLRFFQTARSKIVISFVRYDKKPMSFTFYTKGFNEAFKNINGCQ